MRWCDLYQECTFISYYIAKFILMNFKRYMCSCVSKELFAAHAYEMWRNYKIPLARFKYVSPKSSLMIVAERNKTINVITPMIDKTLRPPCKSLLYTLILHKFYEYDALSNNQKQRLCNPEWKLCFCLKNMYCSNKYGQLEKDHCVPFLLPKSLTFAVFSSWSQLHVFS